MLFLKSYKVLALISVFLFGVSIGMAFPKKASTSNLENLEAGVYTSNINIVAVKSNGEGEVSSAEVEIRKTNQKSRVLFNTNPFVEPDTQYSIEKAKNIAESYTGKKLEGMDVIYTINSKAQLVGGPSAGAALTIATISAILKKPVRKDVVITGTIEENGLIGRVGGVLEKGIAAAKNNAKLFLVPRGQAKIVAYEKKVSSKKGIGFILRKTYYEPVEIDLNSVFYEEYGMQVKEVTSIREAAQAMIINK